MQNTVRDYQADKSNDEYFRFSMKKKTKTSFCRSFFLKDKIKDFLNEFEVDTDDGYKASKYVKQLVKRIELKILS